MPKEPKAPSDAANGLTIELSRKGAAGDASPWNYEGTVTRGVRKIAVSARIAGDGTVEVSFRNSAHAEDAASPEIADLAALRERVRLLLRACHRQAIAEGLSAPPRKIVRWREERV